MIERWWLAIRPKTLPAAASPVLVGAALAFRDGGFRWGPALAALLGAELLQIGSNLANDVFDYERGTDAGERLGPTRVTQSGLLSPRQVKWGMVFVFGLAALVGLYLIFVGGWPILVLGAAAILSAIAYTGGPYPLGYYGLGDLFVFLFFGLGATAGTYYVQTGTVSPAVWGMSAAMGMLTVMILVVNNLRDIETDRKAGKKTLAVRLGIRGTRVEYVLCAVSAYLIPLVLWLIGLISPWGLLTWLSLPLAARWVKTIYTQTGRILNRALAGTGQLTLVYALLFSLKIFIERWIV